MAVSTINRVKDAEIASSQKKDQAALDAQKIIDEANKKAEEIVLNAKNVENEKSQEKIISAKNEAEKYIEKIKTEAEESAKAFFDETIKKQDIVNKKVMDIIV